MKYWHGVPRTYDVGLREIWQRHCGISSTCRMSIMRRIASGNCQEICEDRVRARWLADRSHSLTCIDQLKTYYYENVTCPHL